MLKQLYMELAELDLKYHELGQRESGRIDIKATSMDPLGVDEVIRIKEVADHHHAFTSWDGKDIKIVHPSWYDKPPVSP